MPSKNSATTSAAIPAFRRQPWKKVCKGEGSVYRGIGKQEKLLRFCGLFWLLPSPFVPMNFSLQAVVFSIMLEFVTLYSLAATMIWQNILRLQSPYFAPRSIRTSPSANWDLGG